MEGHAELGGAGPEALAIDRDLRAGPALPWRNERDADGARDIRDIEPFDAEDVAHGVVDVGRGAVVTIDDGDEAIQLVVNVVNRRERRLRTRSRGRREEERERQRDEQKDGDGVPVLRRLSQGARHVALGSARACKDRARSRRRGKCRQIVNSALTRRDTSAQIRWHNA